MHDDVCTIFDRLEQDQGGDRVIHDQRNPVPMSNAGERLDIADVPRGIAYALAKHGSGIAVDELFYGRGLIRFGEADRYALLREYMSK